MVGDRSVAVRLAGFGLALVVAFGAAFGVGRTVGPLDDGRPTVGVGQHDDGSADGDPADHGSADHDGGHR